MARKLTKQQVKRKRAAQKKRTAERKAKSREILFRRFICPAIEKMKDSRVYAPDNEGEIEEIIWRKSQGRPLTFKEIKQAGEAAYRKMLLHKTFSE